jgi:hypothetical protein
LQPQHSNLCLHGHSASLSSVCGTASSTSLLIMIPVIGFAAHPNNPEQFPCSKTLSHICIDYFFLQGNMYGFQGSGPVISGWPLLSHCSRPKKS